MPGPAPARGRAAPTRGGARLSRPGRDCQSTTGGRTPPPGPPRHDLSTVRRGSASTDRVRGASTPLSTTSRQRAAGTGRPQVSHQPWELHLRTDDPAAPQPVDRLRGTTRDREPDRRRGLGPGTHRPDPDDLPPDVRVARPAALQRRPEPEPDRLQEPERRAGDVPDADLECRQPCRLGGPGRPFRGGPFRARRVVLDEERRTVGLEVRCGGEPPRHDPAIRPLPLARLDRPERRATRPKVGRIPGDVVGRDRPGRQPRPGLGVEHAQRRPPDPRLAGQFAVERADQFQIGVAEPDQPVERSESVVPATSARRQPERRRQLCGRVVRVGHGDHEVVDADEHRESVAGRPARYDARVSPVGDGHLRVERTGAAGEVARVTLARPEVHNAFDATLIADLRATFAQLARERPTAPAGRRPGRRRSDLLRRRRHRLDARRDGPRYGGQRAGRDGDGRHVRGDRHLPRPGHRSGPGRRDRGRDGPVRGGRPRHRRIGRPVRVHRDAPRDPAVGHQPVRHRQDRREPRPGAVPRRSPIRCHPCRSDRAGPRDRRGAGRARRRRKRRRGRRAGGGPDRRARREGDRPRGPRPRPRLGQVAHRPGHRPPADERGGPGGVPRLRREAPASLGAGPGRRLRPRLQIGPLRSTMPPRPQPAAAASRRHGRRRRYGARCPLSTRSRHRRVEDLG